MANEPVSGSRGNIQQTPESRDLERLKDIFVEKAFLKRRPPEKKFKLASGGSSWTYFDCKTVTQDPEGISIIARVVFDKVSRYEDLDAIGGLETGAIPIAVAVAQLSFQKDRPIPAFFVRHDKKTHGTEKWIEGNLKPGSKVVILEDVTTKGTSAEEAIRKVEKMNCKVLELITLVDREEGAAAKFEKSGYRFTPIFKMSEFAVSNDPDV